MTEQTTPEQMVVIDGIRYRPDDLTHTQAQPDETTYAQPGPSSGPAWAEPDGPDKTCRVCGGYATQQLDGKRFCTRCRPPELAQMVASW